MSQVKFIFMLARKKNIDLSLTLRLNETDEDNKDLRDFYVFNQHLSVSKTRGWNETIRGRLYFGAISRESTLGK